MSANVEITDTFDQWRVKNNELLVATQTDGSSNFIKLTNTTDSTSNTTGSIITAGGMGIAKNLFVGTNLDVAGTTNLDAIDIDGAVQIDATVTVGVNDTGYDVKFFGATTGKSLVWDESADSLIVTGTTTLVGTTNLDAVDIDGATQIDATVTVGVDDTGYDVKFFGATTGQHLLWDQSADELALVGDTKLSFHDAAGGENIVASSDGHLEINSATTLDITAPTVDVNASTKLNVDGATQLTGAVTVGVDDTGHDVKFFGASAGAFMLYDQSADQLIIQGASADATTSTGKLLLSTSLTDINDGDVIGRIDFQAPLEAGATDSRVVGATILAEADATFSSSVNSTDLVFLTGDSGAATEKLRIDSTGQTTFADGAIDVNIASHDGTNGLALGGTVVTTTAAEINKIAGGTSRVTTAVASGDGILINDGGTMAMTNVDTVSTYFSSHSVGGGNIVTTGALNSGSITSGFGTIDTGASAITTTGLISGGSLDIDNVLINGTTIGHTDDTDLLTVADAALTLKGTLTVGVDDTGHDVKFFGASAGAFMLYDESADQLVVQGASADATTSSGKLLLSTSLTDINDGDVLGRIDFQAPLEAGDTDSRVVGATILAEADATFSSSVNSTDLVFLTGDSGAATEKLRIDSTGQTTFADGAIDVNIASHDGTNGLALGGTVVTTTAAEINKIAGGTSRVTTAVASGDGILINDGGTMAMTNVDTVSTYFSSHSVGGGNIVTTGALNSGSITSGFGTIDTGASAITTTGLISGGSLDIDNVLINGTTIGHTDDTDLLTVADAALTLKGTLTVGVDDTGHDVKFFGATAGAFLEWDESADELEIRGGAATPGKLLLSTAEATVVDGNKLGQIDFQAPAETGTDALVVGASIVAEADATFSATVNSTDLVFLTADSGAATEKLRIDSTGQVTFADGAIDVNIASHDGSNGLKLGGTLVTSTAAQLNAAANAATTGKAIAMAIVFG